ncbi:MAG: CDP-alcohol phosphatidyltransferase family protein [Myxococcales bacterium]|nr:CDP-alcohol phosphatidyltransferase family protein [Myxococcales bacterium]
MNALLRSSPHALTLGNVLCGTAALGALIGGGSVHRAAALVALGLLFDLLDGRTARRLGVQGPFGAQLDSLADVITFGLAPAGVLYVWKLAPLGGLGQAAVAALVVAAVTRLARFTSAAGAPPAPGPARFRGLAVTLPAAIILGAAVADLAIPAPVAAGVAFALAGLMVSALPYRSFKDRSVAWVLAPVAALTLALGLYSGQALTGLGLALALGGAGYALSAPVARLARCLHARATH